MWHLLLKEFRVFGGIKYANTQLENHMVSIKEEDVKYQIEAE